MQILFLFKLLPIGKCCLQALLLWYTYKADFLCSFILHLLTRVVWWGRAEQDSDIIFKNAGLNFIRLEVYNIVSMEQNRRESKARSSRLLCVANAVCNWDGKKKKWAKERRLIFKVQTHSELYILLIFSRNYFPNLKKRNLHKLTEQKCRWVIGLKYQMCTYVQGVIPTIFLSCRLP